jgi:hypothetical protein
VGGKAGVVRLGLLLGQRGRGRRKSALHGVRLGRWDGGPLRRRFRGTQKQAQMEKTVDSIGSLNIF